MRIALISCDTQSAVWRQSSHDARFAWLDSVCGELEAGAGPEETGVVVAPEHYWSLPGTAHAVDIVPRARAEDKQGTGSALEVDAKNVLKERLATLSGAHPRLFVFPGTISVRRTIAYHGEKGGASYRWGKAYEAFKAAKDLFGKSERFATDWGGTSPSGGTARAVEVEHELNVIGWKLRGELGTAEDLTEEELRSRPFFRQIYKQIPTHFIVNKLYVLYGGAVVHRHRKIVQWQDTVGDYESVFRSGTGDSMRFAKSGTAFGVAICRDFVIITGYEISLPAVDYFVLASSTAEPEVEPFLGSLVDGGFFCQSDSVLDRTRLFRREKLAMTPVEPTRTIEDGLFKAKLYVE